MSDQPLTSPQVPPVKDWLFETLVRLVNQTSGSVSVTVSIPGCALTGELIDVRTFFFEYAKHWQFVVKNDDEAARRIRESWEAVGEKERKTFLESKDQRVEFFHLRETKLIVSQESVPPIGGFLWRGRISEVSGFGLGTLSRR